MKLLDGYPSNNFPFLDHITIIHKFGSFRLVYGTIYTYIFVSQP
jgi:hypothetical protein